MVLIWLLHCLLISQFLVDGDYVDCVLVRWWCEFTVGWRWRCWSRLPCGVRFRHDRMLHGGSTGLAATFRENYDGHKYGEYHERDHIPSNRQVFHFAEVTGKYYVLVIILICVFCYCVRVDTALPWSANRSTSQTILIPITLVAPLL